MEKSLKTKRLWDLPHFFVPIFLALCAVLLFTDSNLKQHEWYSTEYGYSDWRGVPAVDYSTNCPCSLWYSGHQPLYFRPENIKRFLAEPDTVTLGIDYYGFFGISFNVIQQMGNETIARRIENGEVAVARCYHGRIVSIGFPKKV